jgi:hypothetical protein
MPFLASHPYPVDCGGTCLAAVEVNNFSLHLSSFNYVGFEQSFHVMRCLQHPTPQLKIGSVDALFHLLCTLKT